jgi:hypothetical protein
VQRYLATFHVGDGLFDPICRQGIKALSKKFAVLSDRLIEFDAFVAHGPLAVGREQTTLSHQ